MQTDPTKLDGFTFVPEGPDREYAYDGDGAIIGQIELEEVHNRWQARFGSGEWKKMRRRSEARAFIVSMALNNGEQIHPHWRRP